MEKYIYLLKNLNDTNNLAKIIAKVAKPNLILLLNGQLAAGKTQITKFIGNFLGVKKNINSPTFLIWNNYQTKYKWNLIHMDAYRLTNSNLVEEYYELFINNFIIIEWPENLKINFNNYFYISINLKILENGYRKIFIKTNFSSEIKNKYFFDSIKKTLFLL